MRLWSCLLVVLLPAMLAIGCLTVDADECWVNTSGGLGGSKPIPLGAVGATGSRFGIHNETTLGAGLFAELVNVSAGLSLAELSLPICGPRLCGQVRGLAPGANVRLDLFAPYLSGSLGISIDCAGTWITGGASPVWSGISVRCSAGPVFRFAPHS